MRGRRRGITWIGLSVAAVITLTACPPGGGGPDDSESPGGPGPGGDDVLVVGTTEKPSTIDPAEVYEKMASDFLFNTTSRLVELEPGTGDVIAGAASDWEISDDGLTYTFTLREGLTFHDGSDLTSEDVKYSLERALNMNHPDGASFLIAAIDSIETPDDTTVVITIGTPNVTFLSRLAYTVASIIPSDGVYEAPDARLGPEGEAAEAAEADAFVNTETIVGSGPYEMVEYSPDTGARFEAFDGYYGDAPLIPTVVLQFFEGSAQLKNAIDTGDVDLNINDLGPAERSSLSTTEGVTVEEGDNGRIRYIVLDVNQEPWTDPQVRQALSSSVGRQEIIDEVFEGAGEPLYSMIPPSFPAGKDYISEIDVSLDAPVAIDLWYPLNKYGDTEADVGQVIKRTLEDSGNFTVTLHESDWATEFSNNLSNGTYAAYLLAWYPDYIDPDDYIEPFYHTDGFIGFYSSEEMDGLIGDEQQELDLDARAAIFDSIQQLAAEDMPFVPLYVESTYAYYQEDLTGVEHSIDVAIQARWNLIGRG